MMEASCFELRRIALGTGCLLVRSTHILIGRFGALPCPTSVDAAMKIRGQLFYGRTVESRD